MKKDKFECITLSRDEIKKAILKHIGIPADEKVKRFLITNEKAAIIVDAEPEKISKEELAKRLDGNIVEHEISSQEIKLAKESGLVVLYAVGDYIAEFCGAIETEISCYKGGTIPLVDSLLSLPDGCKQDECQLYKSALAKCDKKIEAIYLGKGSLISDYYWVYETDIPHANFEIKFVNGTKFCRGIVFNLDDLKEQEDVKDKKDDIRHCKACKNGYRY